MELKMPAQAMLETRASSAVEETMLRTNELLLRSTLHCRAHFRAANQWVTNSRGRGRAESVANRPCLEERQGRSAGAAVVRGGGVAPIKPRKRDESRNQRCRKDELLGFQTGESADGDRGRVGALGPWGVKSCFARVFLAMMHAASQTACVDGRNFCRGKKWIEDSCPDYREREIGRKTPHGIPKCYHIRCVRQRRRVPV